MNLEEILLTSAEFNSFVADQITFLKDRINQSPVSLMPLIAIKTLGDDGKTGLTMAAMAMPFNEDYEKRFALNGIARSCYARRQIPLAIALSAEAWWAQEIKGVEPRHCTFKSEIVMVSALSLDQKFVKMFSLPVRRDERNRMHPVEGTAQSGREIGILRLPILEKFYSDFAKAVMETQGKTPQ